MKLLFYDPKYIFAIKDPNYPVGGATIQMIHWIKGFAELNQEVYVLTLKVPEVQDQREGHVRVLPAYDNDKGIKILRWIYYRVPSIYQQLKKTRPDIVIQAKASFITAILAIICKRLKIKFVYRVANDIETDGRLLLRKSSYERALFDFALRNTDAIICQNNLQHANLQKRYPNKPLIVISNPFPVENSFPEAQHKTEYVAWVGIFQGQKNLPALLEIVKALPHISFKIAGSHTGKLDDASESALNGIRDCKNAELMGYLPKEMIPGFLAKAYLLLNTSHYEGFSNAFLEAFAVGTPVVAPRTVDPDLIIHKNQLGASVNHYMGFPAAITSLISDPSYPQMRARCFQYVSEKHDLRNLSKAYLSFLSNTFSL